MTEEQIINLLNDVARFFETYDGTKKTIGKLEGSKKEVFETLLSLEYICSSISSTLLRLAADGRSFESHILERSLIEAHSKYMMLITHKDGPDVALWEYQECLPLIIAKSEESKLQRAMKQTEKNLSHSKELLEEAQKNISNSIEAARNILKRKRMVEHPLSKKKINPKMLQEIRKRWEVEELLSYTSTPQSFDFDKAIIAYSDASKASHIDSSKLFKIELGESRAANIVNSARENQWLIIHALSFAADRRSILNKAIRQEHPYLIEEEFIEVMRRVFNAGLRAIPLQYLGKFRAVETEGERLCLVFD